MQHLLKRPGYRLYAPDSPEARVLLAEQGLGPADLERALARLETAEGTAVRTIVGINEDGVFGSSREGWRPDLPDACHEPFVPLLWVKVHELLGRVPAGSTVRFVRDAPPYQYSSRKDPDDIQSISIYILLRQDSSDQEIRFFLCSTDLHVTYKVAVLAQLQLKHICNKTARSGGRRGCRALALRA